jgi:hypothetical protein
MVDIRIITYCRVLESSNIGSELNFGKTSHLQADVYTPSALTHVQQLCHKAHKGHCRSHDNHMTVT